MALDFTQKVDGTKLKIYLEGKLDTNTSPQLDEFLKENLAGKTELLLDFGKLVYISSAGLRVILSAQKVMNKQGVMWVMHVNDSIMEIFEATGLDDILSIV